MTGSATQQSTTAKARPNRLSTAARGILSALPTGTIPVGVGLAVSGVAVYGFLGISARVLGPEAYAPLSVLWSLVFMTGPGLFLPLEQEVGRTLAGDGISNPYAGSVLRRGAALGAMLAFVTVTFALVFRDWIVEHLFAGQSWLLVSFCIAIPAMAAMHLLRGALAGQAKFREYSVLIGTEGAVRLVVAAVLALAGVVAVADYGMLVGLAPVVAVALVALIGPPHVPGVREKAPWRRLAESYGFLLVGSLVLQTLINAGPLAVQLLASDDESSAAGRLLTGLVLTRIPLFMFQAVQAALLPKLAALGTAGEFEAFRQGIRRLLLAIGALTAGGVLAAATIGPAMLQLLFGSEFTLTRMDLVLLTLSSCLMMVAQACGAALVALRRHAKAALGWLCGGVAFVLVTLLGHGLFTRVEYGLIAGALVAAVLLGGTLAATFLRARRDATVIVEEPEPLL